MAMLTDIRNRGMSDVFFLVCDGLKGLPDAVGNVWPLATVQTCIIRLIPNTFRLASKRTGTPSGATSRRVYTAGSPAAARAAMDQVTEAWGSRCPATARLWTTPGSSSSRSWTTTSRSARCCAPRTIESLNARYQRAVKARGHFPAEQAALKCLYLVTRSLDPAGIGGHDGPYGGSRP
jgi:putative transposase